MFGANPSIFFKTHPDPDLHVDPGAASGQKFLLPGVYDLDWLTGLARQDGSNYGIVVVGGLPAEPAPHGALDDAHIGLSNSQGRRDPSPRHKDGLGVHVDGVLPTGIIIGHAANGFDGTVPLRHALESILHNQIRFGKGTLDIAALHIKLHGDVTLFIFVDEWGAFFHGLFGVEDRGKLLPLDVDQVHGLFSDVPVDGRYGCDFFAHVTGFTFREGVLVGKKRPPASFDGILSCYHGSNTSHFCCLAGIDLDNPGMVIGTAKEFYD